MSAPLTWRSAPPSTEGWWWFRHPGVSPRVVHFYRNGYATTALHADQTFLFPRGAKLEFAGPVQPPLEAIAPALPQELENEVE